MPVAPEPHAAALVTILDGPSGVTFRDLILRPSIAGHAMEVVGGEYVDIIGCTFTLSGDSALVVRCVCCRVALKAATSLSRC